MRYYSEAKYEEIGMNFDEQFILELIVPLYISGVRSNRTPLYDLYVIIMDFIGRHQENEATSLSISSVLFSILLRQLFVCFVPFKYLLNLWY